MVTVDPLHVLTGPFGVALALLVGLGASWRVVRRLPADRRRRRVRIALAVVLLATLGWTWGRPDRLGPSRLLLGRHAWLEVRDTTDPATGATRRSPRVVGPNLVASVLESAVAVALVIGADLGIAGRLASRDARHCPRCGYPRPDAGPAHAGRGDGGSGATLIDAADRRCPECGLALAARTAETAPSSPSS